MIKFGPSGNSESFYRQGYKHSIDAAEWLKKLELNAYEYAFTYGVNIGDDLAKAMASEFKKNDVEISVHAPYYINFAGINDDLLEKSYGYIIDSLKKLKLLGGKRVVYHVGTCGKLTREEAFNLVKERSKELVKRIKAEGLDDMYICPETMGKSAQIGTYKEIAEICAIDKMFIPCIDFGHINAYTQGWLKDTAAFRGVVKYFIDNIGLERTKKMHVHFSKIEYGAKGEIKHLTFEDTVFGPEFEHLAPVIKEFGLEPFIICESRGCQAEDAVIMKKIYEKTR